MYFKPRDANNLIFDSTKNVSSRYVQFCTTSNLFKYLPNTKTEEALKLLPIFQVIQKSIFLYINSSMYQSML